MKKFILSAIVFCTVSLSVSAQSTAKFVAPTLNEIEQTNITAKSDISEIKSEVTAQQKAAKIIAIAKKQEISLAQATATMISEVKTALSDESQDKAFEKRNAAWLKEAKAKKEAKQTYVQEILDII